MNDELDEPTYFRYFRKHDGRLEAIDVARRNGRLVPRFSPQCTEAEVPDSKDSSLKELVREVMYGLNRTERRTWRLLLLGNSILETAGHERVSRAAVYERIRGNSKGQGGMVKKNDYVPIWWGRRQKETRKQDHL